MKISETEKNIFKVTVAMICAILLTFSMFTKSAAAQSEPVKTGDIISIKDENHFTNYISKNCYKSGGYYYPLYAQVEHQDAGKYEISKDRTGDGEQIYNGDYVKLITVDETCYDDQYSEYNVLTYPWQALYYSLYLDIDTPSHDSNQRWKVIKEGGGSGEPINYGDVVFLQSQETQENSKGIRPENDQLDDYLRNDNPWISWEFVKR